MPPLRQATRKYASLGSFLTEYESTLSKGVLLLPGDQAGGELAPEIKLDLVLPLVGRVGPVAAQTVARMPDGGVALRLPEIPPAVEGAFRRVFEIVDEVRAHLLSTGSLVEPGAAQPVVQLEDDEDTEVEEAPDRVDEDEVLDEEVLRDDDETYDDEGYDDDDDDDDEIIEDALSRTAPLPAPPLRARGVPWVNTGALEQRSAGALGDGSLRRVLIGLALGRHQGALMVELPDGRLRLGYWRAGGPVAWRAEPPMEDELLGNLLLRGGQITQAQLSATLEEMERGDRRQGELLVSMGALQAQQLPLVLARQSEFILMRVLQEKAGSWAFFDMAELPEAFEAPPVPVAAVLLRAFVSQARKLPAPQLRGALKRSLEQSLTLPAEAVIALREFRYSKEEAQLLDALRLGSGTVGELVEKGPAPFEVAAPLVWALMELGLASQAKKESRDDRLQRVAATLAAKKKQVAHAGPFEVLELSWICLHQEIERSRDRLRRELSPAVLGELTPELEAVAQEVLALVERAASLLLDPRERRKYRRSIISPEDLERSAELLRAAAEDARVAGDAGRAAIAEAKAAEILAS